MEEIATLSGGMAFSYHTAMSYVSLSASCASICTVHTKGGVGGGQDLNNPVLKGWAISYVLRIEATDAWRGKFNTCPPCLSRVSQQDTAASILMKFKNETKKNKTKRYSKITLPTVPARDLYNQGK